MTVSPFDSDIYGSLFADGELNALFSDEAAVRTMVAFEVVLARVEARLQIIPASAADAIERAAAAFTPDMDGIAAGTAQAGVPVVPLIRQLRGSWLLGGGGAAPAEEPTRISPLKVTP